MNYVRASQGLHLFHPFREEYSMVYFETLNGLIALLAVFVSVIAVKKTAAVSKEANRLSQENVEISNKQLALEKVQAELNKKLINQMEADEKKRRIPVIDVDYELGEKSNYFIVINKGHIKAHDIDLRFLSTPQPDLLDIEGKIPCEELNPTESIKIRHIPTRGDYAPKYKVEIIWHDSDGKQFIEHKNVYR